MRALAGLGNPGERYRRHRHNAGRMLVAVLEARHAVIDAISLQWVDLTCIRMKGQRAEGGPAKLWLMRSKTYMNESGLAVSEGSDHLRLVPEELLIAFDDVDLPLGKLRLREAGGSGGQLGMQSVIDALGTEAIPRLRLGICGDERGADTADYVLHDFGDDEGEVAAEMIEKAADAVEAVVRGGLVKTMNQYN